MSISAPGFDWPALLKVAVQDAGLKPWEFWRLTPAELVLFLGLDAVEKPLNRARLAELERLYSTKERSM
ncbi:phage tail assembly chaperone [Litoreibacter roseus]|uniref:Phage tail assembly chaperone n=1 Tax=Litoreibacter roseus TaxID=2601869 RepID=A0A6N6JKM0_9RHOB|nr:phage tail assembly chaperone [Litoreibacter roseus]GFE66704.1 hypothetical protein KIN_37780 [Litoreibacter roseus]